MDVDVDAAAAAAAPDAAPSSRSAGRGKPRRPARERARLRHPEGRFTNPTSKRAVAAAGRKALGLPQNGARGKGEHAQAAAVDAARGAEDAARGAHAAHLRVVGGEAGATDALLARHAAIRVLASARAQTRGSVVLLGPTPRVPPPPPLEADAADAAAALCTRAAHAASTHALRRTEHHLARHEHAWRRRAAGLARLMHTAAGAAAARSCDVELVPPFDARAWSRSSPHTAAVMRPGLLLPCHARAALRQGTAFLPVGEQWTTAQDQVCGDVPASGSRGGVTHVACPSCGADTPRDGASTVGTARRSCVLCAEATAALELRLVPPSDADPSA